MNTVSQNVIKSNCLKFPSQIILLALHITLTSLEMLSLYFKNKPF